MEEIKLQIAKEDGFDSWDMMIQCYCTTKHGQRVLKKNTEKALNMYIVSQQRELLKVFIEWYNKEFENYDQLPEHIIDMFIGKTFNCG